MTAQDLITLSLPYIDEIGSTYGADYLPFVSKVISDLMRQEIGINPSYQRVDLSDYTEDYSVDDYIPVRLTATDEDQIINVQMDGYPSMKMYTETTGAYFYLLVPDTYSGIVEIKWMAQIPNFTSLTDVIPISDAAAVNVAAIGVAALLAVSEAEDKVSYLEAKYQEAIRDWKKRKINRPRRVREAYILEY